MGIGVSSHVAKDLRTGRNERAADLHDPADDEDDKAQRDCCGRGFAEGGEQNGLAGHGQLEQEEEQEGQLPAVVEEQLELEG